MKRIVVTGGHHNSALVIAQILRKKGFKVYWFGHKNTMRGDPSISAEYKEVTRAGFDFVTLKAGKFYKNYNPLQHLRTILGFVQSFYHLVRLRPLLIVSFGGYLAVPVVLVGFFLRIPSVTHEQTAVAGWANRIISLFAKKVFITWPTSKRFFPRRKTELIGLPLRQSIFVKPKKKLFDNNQPTIFVTGGKQGCHILNKAVEEVLLRLLASFNLIHQTGSVVKTNDLGRLTEKRKLLPAKLTKKYYLKDYLYHQEQDQALNSADLVIGRAGGHIVYELAFLGKPAILIPIARSVNNEQAENAKILHKFGLAKILPEDQLSGEKLMSMIEKFFQEKKDYAKAKAQLQKLIFKDAAEKLINYCLKKD